MPTNKKQTRVVVSLGPALDGEADIAKAIELDSDFRQPFGYRVQDHFTQFSIVDKLRNRAGKTTQIYVDLPSERPRVGVLKTELHFEAGQQVRVTATEQADIGDEVAVPDLARFLSAIEPGHRLLIRDGHTVLRVKAIVNGALATEVERAIEGVATNNNIMFPDSAVGFEPVVEADRVLLHRFRHASFVPDWVMLSLVTSVQQVESAKEVLRDIFEQQMPLVMVKIETAKSVERMSELLAASDGLLVGRGDLGMTMPPECIPAIQEDVVAACRRAQKPVLVATEFLQRFAETGVPNRAELSDLALAARQGVSGIVLTKETSGSKYALESIRLARRVIQVEAGRGA